MRYGLVAAAVVVSAGMGSASAATLLYQWNFDNNGGTGTVVNPTVTPNGLASDGGVLTMAQAKGVVASPTATNLYGAGGTGVTGAVGDYAVDNSASVSNNPNPGGIVYSNGAADPNNANTLNALPNIGPGQAVTEYTMTAWVKPTAAELSVQSRIFQIGTTTGYDEKNAGQNGIWMALNTGKVQTGTGAGAGSADSGAAGNTLVAGAWNFIAVQVDLASANVFFDADMRAATGNLRNDSFQLFQGDSVSGIYGYTAQNGFANGTISYAGQPDYVSMLNRSNDFARAFQGQADDFRIYSGLLTTAELNTLAAEAPGAAPEPASVGVLVVGAAGLLARRRRR